MTVDSDDISVSTGSQGDRLQVSVTPDAPAPRRPGPGDTDAEGGRGRFSVVIVDDHELIRHGLRRAFERAGDFTVVGEAGSVAEARSVVPSTRPDVVVTDVRLPDGDGIALARSLRAADERLGIVVLTMYAGDEHLLGALEAGASAFVNKDAPADDVVAAARHAAANPRSFAAQDLAGAMQRKLRPPTGPKLSEREREVLGLLVEGLSAGQMARRLYISESTVKTHISKMYDKLGATNRAQAVMAAVRLGLVAENAPADH
jgi:DNA-binding NarL/FixJ family response regulator